MTPSTGLFFTASASVRSLVRVAVVSPPAARSCSRYASVRTNNSRRIFAGGGRSNHWGQSARNAPGVSWASDARAGGGAGCMGWDAPPRTLTLCGGEESKYEELPELGAFTINWGGEGIGSLPPRLSLDRSEPAIGYNPRGRRPRDSLAQPTIPDHVLFPTSRTRSLLRRTSCPHRNCRHRLGH
jgi:hypothetical protein